MPSLVQRGFACTLTCTSPPSHLNSEPRARQLRSARRIQYVDCGRAYTACSWQSDALSLARVTLSIRGFPCSRLPAWRAFPPFGFVLSQALLLSCVVSRLQPRGQVFPLTARCFCSTLSGRYLFPQVYPHIFIHLATISFPPINSSKSCCPTPPLCPVRVADPLCTN